MNVAQLADQLRKDSMFMKDVTRWEVIPARRARTAPFPACMDGRLKPALESRGIHELYIHQVRSLEATDRGEDVTVVTPTASGKTMCYNLPVLSAILKDEDARALYIFPTKALSADQVSELYDMIEEIGVDIKTYTYDGDTPAAARKAVRQAGHIVVTNPDMLHSGILPHHTKWVKLFENLKYIVIDEIEAKTQTKLVSIPKAVADEAAKNGYRKVGLLGTIFTMEQDYMKKDLLDAGIEIFVPEKSDREIVAKRIFEELEVGIVKESTLKEFTAIIEKMKNERGIQALILGCTELPLLLNKNNCPVDCLDSVEIHLQKLIELARD